MHLSLDPIGLQTLVLVRGAPRKRREQERASRADVSFWALGVVFRQGPDSHATRRCDPTGMKPVRNP